MPEARFDEYEFDVCQNCLVVVANGDDSGRSEGAPEPLSIMAPMYLPHLIATDLELGFRNWYCEGCDDLPGDRFRVIALVEVPQHEIDRHRAAGCNRC